MEEILLTTERMYRAPVNNGTNDQPQLVSRIFSINSIYRRAKLKIWVQSCEASFNALSWGENWNVSEKNTIYS